MSSLPTEPVARVAKTTPSLDHVPSTQAPLAALVAEPSSVVATDVKSTEPPSLRHGARDGFGFLEATSRPVLPKFEVFNPTLAAAQWSESSGDGQDVRAFRQSGTMGAARFDESATTLSFRAAGPDPAIGPHELIVSTDADSPWVGAIDEHRWVLGHQALAVVGIGSDELEYPIMFAGPNGATKGTTFTIDRHIEVYIGNEDTVRDIAHVLAHELAHAFDVSWLSPDDRRRWLSARSLAPTTPWWPSENGSDLVTGSGDFAECFASWRVSVPSRSRLAGSCEDQFALLEELWTQKR